MRTLTLYRKGVAQSGPFQGSGTLYSEAWIGVGNGDLVAINSNGSLVSVVGKRDGNLVVAVLNEEWRNVEYFVFRIHEPSDARYGMQIFDGNGNLTYDTGRPPLNLIAEVGGPGDYWQTGGRKYAVVPATCYFGVKQEIVLVGVGPRPDYMGFVYATADFFRTFHDLVRVERPEYYVQAYGPYANGSGQLGWLTPGEWSNNQNTKFLVVDVTNF
eukprot:TRINITY_DN20890_c0_g1_i2.p1 TRINITY_DN20890_c0_g1~~TRINITY_DN20890_c0_g1_i2.p1  ORF type:complete len:214 (+),score=39.05 TRINITY_DN20890_c0_g1_i2:106-747(+)